MNLSYQDSPSFDHHSPKLCANSVMIILGHHLGLGALIQSTVNSIWLAQKLNKSIYIWWGNSCFYTDHASSGNTYTKLFQEPSDHQFNLEQRTIPPTEIYIYPEPWQSVAPCLTIEKIDRYAPNLAASHNLELNSPEKILQSNLCIVYQYLLSDFAINTARSLGIDTSRDQFLDECNEIFRKYFQPHSSIKESANYLWKTIFAKNQDFIIGLHLRGTDKIIEKPVPSPRKYFKNLKKLPDYSQTSSFFVATDSELYLQRIKSYLKSFYVGYQDIKRSQGLSPLHYKLTGVSDGFMNGVAMIIDIELLSKCQIILAFPGSQVFWWLSRKQESENLPLKLQPVNPDLLDWITAGSTVLRSYGIKAFIRFLRYQKHRLMHNYKEKHSKN